MTQNIFTLQWHPGNKPPKSGLYLVTIDVFGDAGYVAILAYFVSNNQWAYWPNIEDDVKRPEFITAWSLLPPPYTDEDGVCLNYYEDPDLPSTH